MRTVKYSSLVIILLIFCFRSAFAQTETDYQTINSGSWNSLSIWEIYEGGQWIPAVVTPDYTVNSITIRTGHTVSINSNLTVDQTEVAAGGVLQHDSGNLVINNGTGDDLIVNGTFRIDSGISGGGSIIINNDCTWLSGKVANSSFIISAGGNLNINGSATKESVTTIDNYGTVSWTGGNLNNYIDGIFNNRADALFIIEGDNTFNNYIMYFSPGEFINYGTIQKTTTDGTTVINKGTFNNFGNVEVSSGTLSVTGSSDNPGYSGSFNVSNGSVIKFSGTNRYLTDTLTFNGNGEIFFESGSCNALPTTGGADGVVFAPGITVKLSEGSFTGSGVIVIEGTFIWSGGTISNTNFNIDSSAIFEITGPANKNITSDGVINNYANATWNEGVIKAWYDGTFNNMEGALFDIQCDVSYQNFAQYHGSGTINNYGTIRKITNQGTTNIYGGVFHNQGVLLATDTTIGVTGSFSNTGEVTLDNAVLNLSGSGDSPGHTGTFNAINDSLIKFFGSTHTFSNNVAFSGDFSLLLESGTFSALSTGGGPGIDFPQEMSFTFTDGTFGGSGSVTFNGPVVWSGGTIANGNFTLSPTSSLLITGSATKKLNNSGVINNYANAIWDEGTINAWANGTFNIMEDALFDIQCDYNYINYAMYFGSGIINNYGTIRKSAGDGSNSIYRGTFNTPGTLIVECGTIFLDDTSFSNYSGNTLLSGKYDIHGILKIHNANITTIQAEVILDGPDSQIVNQNNEDALANLSSVGTNGTFTLSGGRGFNTNAANFTNNGVLDCGEAVFTLTAGSFTNSEASTLMIGSTGGISLSENEGNIQGPGTRTFSPLAHYIYKGLEVQITGNGLPGSVTGFTVENQTSVTLTSDLTVTGYLALENGNLITGDNVITLGTATSGTGDLASGSGKITGNFRRWISAAPEAEILFPLGTDNHLRTTGLEFTAAPASGGTITASFIDSDPGAAGIPLDDSGTEIVSVLSDGYWSLTAGDGLSGGVYDLSLTANGFSGVTDTNDLHLLKRNNGGSNWTIDGSHSPATGSNHYPVIHRTGMSGFSDFGVGSSEAVAPELEAPVVNISVLENTLSLSWEEVTDANSYFIYASEDPYSADWGQHIAHTAELSYQEEIITEIRFFKVTASTAIPTLRLNPGQ
jgi:hypothetical protein